MFHCYVRNVYLQSLILVDSDWPFWVMGHPQVVWPLQTDLMSIDVRFRDGAEARLALVFTMYSPSLPMTDPWCCYIWCAMNPINIPPVMLV